MKNWVPKLGMLLMLSGGLSACSSASASLLLPDMHDAPVIGMGIPNPDTPTTPTPRISVRLHESASMSGFPSSLSVTMTTSGHCAVVAQIHVQGPQLVTRLLAEIVLVLPSPPPDGLLRPPRVA